MIDQRRLPAALEYLYINSAAGMVEAVRNMAIRGAPALGVAGAFGVALDAVNEQSLKNIRENLRRSAGLLKSARPTAVNLGWGVDRILKIVNNEEFEESDLPQRILAEALEMAEEDVRTNLLLSKNGASLIQDGDTIIHHCNTGSLAGVDWGTALGAIRYVHENGKHVHVLVDETRPRLQGSRLTAWECEQYGIPYEIITDNAAGYFLHKGLVQKVFYGADRVAANGDVINKVGTYMLSVAAHANNVPVVCVFPISTLDMNTPNGNMVSIEQRDADEVLDITYKGEVVAPASADALNPAFDVTPHELITALVTELGVIYPPFDQNLARCVYNSRLDK